MLLLGTGSALANQALAVVVLPIACLNALDQRELEHLNLRGRRTLTRGEDGVYRAVLGS